jgi:heterotetrameric sarcosine oxidase delta subunit
MFRIPCPYCGPRDAAEFRHQGESRNRPDPRTVTPKQWRAYLYEKDNVAGWTTETWYHALGCRRFVSVERNTLTNETSPADAPAGPVHPDLPGAGAGADAGAPDTGSARP